MILNVETQEKLVQPFLYIHPNDTVNSFGALFL